MKKVIVSVEDSVCTVIFEDREEFHGEVNVEYVETLVYSLEENYDVDVKITNT